MELDDLYGYKKVQDAARFTLNKLVQFIKPGVSEIDLIEHCRSIQRDAGIDGYWYKGLTALVLVGIHSTLSISSKSYIPSNKPIQHNDVISVDLNPTLNGYCGDYARTFYVESGVARFLPEVNQEFIAGANAQSYLHAKLAKVASTEMTFNNLYKIMQAEIEMLGFEQLDYIGHNIQHDMNEIVFIAPNEKLTLGEAKLFTLEPQIRLKGGEYGFKHENIYFFKDKVLHEL